MAVASATATYDRKAPGTEYGECGGKDEALHSLGCCVDDLCRYSAVGFSFVFGARGVAGQSIVRGARELAAAGKFVVLQGQGLESGQINLCE